MPWLWIPPRGKLEKKPVCSPCGGDETTTYHDTPKQSKKAGHASSLMAGMATVPPSRRHRKGRCWPGRCASSLAASPPQERQAVPQKKADVFSLKLQRNSQPNALLWIPPRGKLEKKPVCSPCGREKQPHTMHSQSNLKRPDMPLASWREWQQCRPPAATGKDVVGRGAVPLR